MFSSLKIIHPYCSAIVRIAGDARKKYLGTRFPLARGTTGGFPEIGRRHRGSMFHRFF